MNPSSFINCFPYWIERRPNAFVAHMDEFPDFTFTAPTVSELIAGIQNAFLEMLEKYLRKADLPVVHSPLPGEEVLVLTPTYAAKVMLILAFKRQKLTTHEFAGLVGCLPQEGSRLLKLTHPTKIDTLHAAFSVLNVRLYCGIEDLNPPMEEKEGDKDTSATAKSQKTAKASKTEGAPGEEAPKKKRGRKPRPRYDEFGNPIIYTRPTPPPKKPKRPRKSKTPTA